MMRDRSFDGGEVGGRDGVAVRHPERPVALIADADAVARAHGEEDVVDVEGAKDFMLRAVHENGVDDIALFDPQSLGDRALCDGSRRHFLFDVPVARFAVIDIARGLRRHRNAQRDAVGAVRRIVLIEGIVDDIVGNARHKVEGHRVVDVLVLLAARVGDADELAAEVKQPAARVALVQGRVDAEGAVGTALPAHFQGDLLVLGADDALRHADALAFGVADGDGGLAHIVAVCNGHRLHVGVEGAERGKGAAQDGDVVLHRAAHIFEGDGAFAVVVFGVALFVGVRLAVAVFIDEGGLVLAAVKVAVDGAGDGAAVLFCVGVLVIDDMIVGHKIGGVRLLVDAVYDGSARRDDDVGNLRRSPEGVEGELRFHALGVNFQGGVEARRNGLRVGIVLHAQIFFEEVGKGELFPRLFEVRFIRVFYGVAAAFGSAPRKNGGGAVRIEHGVLGSAVRCRRLRDGSHIHLVGSAARGAPRERQPQGENARRRADGGSLCKLLHKFLLRAGRGLCRCARLLLFHF